jgi:hypothetical protein
MKGFWKLVGENLIGVCLSMALTALLTIGIFVVRANVKLQYIEKNMITKGEFKAQINPIKQALQDHTGKPIIGIFKVDSANYNYLSIVKSDSVSLCTPNIMSLIIRQ